MIVKHNVAAAAIFGAVTLMLAHTAAGQSPVSCRDTAGRKYADMLVEQCRQASPATRPPCNAANSCDLILSEISRGCRFMNADSAQIAADSPLLTPDGAPFCKDFLEIYGEVPPSFDCAKASSPIEKAICGDRDLARLDAQLGSVFEYALKSLSTTRADQGQWLKRRDSTCGTADSNCLAMMMRTRIDALLAAEQGKPLMGVQAPPLRYEDLAGIWQVRAVRIYDTGYDVTNLISDDPEYMDAKLTFSRDGAVWHPRVPGGPRDEAHDCREPALDQLPSPAPQDVYDVPGGYAVRCGSEQWGPGAVLQGINQDALRLY